MLVLGLLASGGAPGVPTSTMASDGHNVRFCVSNYAPDRVVTVTDSEASVPIKLRTHISGAACTDLPAHTECGRLITRSAVATGIGADGNPAVSRATLKEVANPATCPPTQAPTHHTSTAGGRVSLSGAGIALLSVVGLAVLGMLAIGLVALRRRSVR
jgi:hypothetical protein